MLEKLFTFSALRDGKGGGRVRLKMLHLTTPNKFLARLWSNGMAPDTPAATLPGSPIIRTSCGCELFSTPPTLRLSDIPATLQVTLTCPNVRLSGQLGCCFCRLPLLLAGFLCFFFAVFLFFLASFFGCRYLGQLVPRLLSYASALSAVLVLCSVLVGSVVPRLLDRVFSVVFYRKNTTWVALWPMLANKKLTKQYSPCACLRWPGCVQIFPETPPESKPKPNKNRGHQTSAQNLHTSLFWLPASQKLILWTLF